MELKYFIKRNLGVENILLNPKYVGEFEWANIYSPDDIVLFDGTYWILTGVNQSWHMYPNEYPDWHEYKLQFIYDTTEIDEPIGMDDFKVTFKRSQYHGITSENSVDSLEFVGLSEAIISQYYLSDVDTELIFEVQQKCNPDDIFETVYSGIIDLSSYEYQSGDYCSTKVRIGEIGQTTTFNNRSETEVTITDGQSVDLDGNLTPNENISKYMIFPVKDIFYSILSNSNGMSIYSQNWSSGMSFVKDFPFGDTPTVTEFNQYTGVNTWETLVNGIFQNVSGSNNSYRIMANLRFKISNFNIASGAPSFPDFINSVIVRIYSDNSGSKSLVQSYNLSSQINPASYVSEFNFMIDYPIIVNASKHVWVEIYADFKNYQAGNRISLADSGNVLKMLFKTPSVETSVMPVLVKDVFRRIMQMISGIEFRSDWYGITLDTDTGLYTVGGGALKSITSGLNIRQRSKSNFKMSFKNMFLAMNAIDNLGYGFVNESGQVVLRVERFEYFYKDDIVLDITHPKELIRRFNPSTNKTRMSIGYEKYIAVEELNATDAIHTERTYSGKTKAFDNNNESLCKFIADSFILEFARRAGVAQSTADSKYDSNTFVLCLNMDESGIFNVDTGIEQSGIEFNSPENFTNFRISPARNAIRHRNTLFPNQDNSNVKFISGSGNSNAYGTPVEDMGYFYLNDSGNGTVLHEDADIEAPIPLLKSESIEFEYPLTYSEFKQLKINPYGIIKINGEVCYLNEIVYNFATNEANFKLTPKYV